MSTADSFKIRITGAVSGYRCMKFFFFDPLLALVPTSLIVKLPPHPTPPTPSLSSTSCIRLSCNVNLTIWNAWRMLTLVGYRSLCKPHFLSFSPARGVGVGVEGITDVGENKVHSAGAQSCEMLLFFCFFKAWSGSEYSFFRLACCHSLSIFCLSAENPRL